MDYRQWQLNTGYPNSSPATYFNQVQLGITSAGTSSTSSRDLDLMVSMAGKLSKKSHLDIPLPDIL